MILLTPSRVGAQDGYTVRAKKYIDQYASLAIYEQRKNGIPAAVTLGQGILETEAGASELFTEANNHFGIKCKNGWQGPTFTHTDDAEDECFKKYKCAADSYRDHSELLKRNPRYAPLFKIKPTDYASWSVCLRKCGYATNPQYAQKLIKIIEDFDLQKYTYSAFDNTAFTDNSVNPLASSSPGIDTNKKPVITTDSTTAAKPRENVTPLKPANTTPTLTAQRHIVKEGETLSMIAKSEGIEVKSIRQLNLLNPNEEPLAGAVLELQTPAAQKPAVKVNSLVAHKGNAIVTDNKTQGQNGDYVVINRNNKTAEPVKPQVVTPAPVAATPPAATNNSTPAKTIIIINDPPRRPAPPVERTEEDEANARRDKELADLKAELDKIVYADDSKLLALNVPEPTPEKKPLPEQPVAKSNKFYTVKKGDTAFSIAKRNNITLDQLTKWNNIDAAGVKIGKRLQVKE